MNDLHHTMKVTNFYLMDSFINIICYS